MKILVCKTGEEAKVMEIANDYHEMQSVVDGYIEAIYPYDDLIALVCNDSGKFNGSLPNRALITNGKIRDVIYGDFFLCGIGEEDFTDMPDDLIDKYKELMDTSLVVSSFM